MDKRKVKHKQMSLKDKWDSDIPFVKKQQKKSKYYDTTKNSSKQIYDNFIKSLDK